MLTKIFNIAKREIGFIVHSPIYWFCMILFPVLVTVFFTSLMDAGQPEEMPIGVVDLDNTSTTRTLVRRLDAFQTSKVKQHYANFEEARKAMQRNEIYAFIYFPNNTSAELMSSKQPKISFYYSNACITSGSLIFKDLKTISTLGSAAVGMAKLSAVGKTTDEIKTLLQPIAIDLHTIGNPAVNYNVYLSTSMIPACITLFIFLITAYSVGTEMKFGRQHEWLKMADNNIFIATLGKLLPQFIIFFVMMSLYLIYIYGYLGFPHAAGFGKIFILALLTVLASQGLGLAAFGLAPSLRMSMSICSLWAALTFSVMGSTFPVSAMSPAIQGLASLFPMRHYFVIYQSSIFGGYPFAMVAPHVFALIAFAILPVPFMPRIKKAMQEWVYMP